MNDRIKNSIYGGGLLDLCGEPGYFAKNVQENKIFKKVYCTAYNSEVAKKIQNTFEVDCMPFDFQNDKLQEKFKDAFFDFVTIRWAMNFCIDLDSFAKDLYSKLNNAGMVYMDLSAPAIGTCLRWQFDDYTYEFLYTSETIKKVFAENGFKCVAFKQDAFYYNYLDGISAIYEKIYYKYYELKNRKNFDKKAMQLIQNGYCLVFSKTGK
ncbi:MAG: methyltransferase domain-containing protein [Gammaproteobacteria bacterium]